MGSKEWDLIVINITFLKCSIEKNNDELRLSEGWYAKL